MKFQIRIRIVFQRKLKQIKIEIDFKKQQKQDTMNTSALTDYRRAYFSNEFDTEAKTEIHDEILRIRKDNGYKLSRELVRLILDYMLLPSGKYIEKIQQKSLKLKYFDTRVFKQDEYIEYDYSGGKNSSGLTYQILKATKSYVEAVHYNSLKIIKISKPKYILRFISYAEIDERNYKQTRLELEDKMRPCFNTIVDYYREYTKDTFEDYESRQNIDINDNIQMDSIAKELIDDVSSEHDEQIWDGLKIDEKKAIYYINFVMKYKNKDYVMDTTRSLKSLLQYTYITQHLSIVKEMAIESYLTYQELYEMYGNV
jgi:hypothetical protein